MNKLIFPKSLMIIFFSNKWYMDNGKLLQSSKCASLNIIHKMWFVSKWARETPAECGHLYNYTKVILLVIKSELSIRWSRLHATGLSAKFWGLLWFRGLCYRIELTKLEVNKPIVLVWYVLCETVTFISSLSGLFLKEILERQIEIRIICWDVSQM